MTATAKKKPKPPEKEELFRGTTIPLGIEANKRIESIREYYDLVDSVDGLRFAVVIGARLVAAATKKNAKNSTAGSIVDRAVEATRKSQAARASRQGPTTKPKFMRLRDRDFSRIEHLREFLIKRLEVPQDKLTQSDAIQFSLEVEIGYRSLAEDSLVASA